MYDSFLLNWLILFINVSFSVMLTVSPTGTGYWAMIEGTVLFDVIINILQLVFGQFYWFWLKKVEHVRLFMSLL